MGNWILVSSNLGSFKVHSMADKYFDIRFFGEKNTVLLDGLKPGFDDDTQSAVYWTHKN